MAKSVTLCLSNYTELKNAGATFQIYEAARLLGRLHVNKGRRALDI